MTGPKFSVENPERYTNIVTTKLTGSEIAALDSWVGEIRANGEEKVTRSSLIRSLIKYGLDELR